MFTSDPSEFKGGELEFMDKGKRPDNLKQGQAISLHHSYDTE